MMANTKRLRSARILLQENILNLWLFLFLSYGTVRDSTHTQKCPQKSNNPRPLRLLPPWLVERSLRRNGPRVRLRTRLNTTSLLTSPCTTRSSRRLPLSSLSLFPSLLTVLKLVVPLLVLLLENSRRRALSSLLSSTATSTLTPVLPVLTKYIL